jgi:hypothetical protein
MIDERDPSDDRSHDRPTAAEYAEQFRTMLRRAATQVGRPWFHMSIASVGEEPQQMAYRERVYSTSCTTRSACSARKTSVDGPVLHACCCRGNSTSTASTQ